MSEAICTVETIEAFVKYLSLIDKEKILVLVSFKWGVTAFDTDRSRRISRTFVEVQLSSHEFPFILIANIREYSAELPDVIPFLFQVLSRVKDELNARLNKKIIFILGLVSSPVKVHEYTHIDSLLELERLKSRTGSTELIESELSSIFSDIISKEKEIDLDNIEKELEEILKI